jgi:hypothetical protein
LSGISLDWIWELHHYQRGRTQQNGLKAHGKRETRNFDDNGLDFLLGII